MSRPVRLACRSAAQRPACPLFLFPTCAVRDKARLFSQRLIVPLARWCAWTALISPALSSPGKDFLLVLPLPVRTGSVDERWGAAEDRRGRDVREYFTFFLCADSTFLWSLSTKPEDVFLPYPSSFQGAVLAKMWIQFFVCFSCCCCCCFQFPKFTTYKSGIFNLWWNFLHASKMNY